MTVFEQREQDVLDYLRAEVVSPGTALPLAGLKLDQFRAARARLAAKDLAVCRSDGRWIPTAMQTRKERDTV